MNDNVRQIGTPARQSVNPSTNRWSEAGDAATAAGLFPGSHPWWEHVRATIRIPACASHRADQPTTPTVDEDKNIAGQKRYDAIRAHLATLTTEELNDTAADALHWLSEVLTNPSEFTRANAKRFLAQIDPPVG